MPDNKVITLDNLSRFKDDLYNDAPWESGSITVKEINETDVAPELLIEIYNEVPEILRVTSVEAGIQDYKLNINDKGSNHIISYACMIDDAEIELVLQYRDGAVTLSTNQRDFLPSRFEDNLYTQQEVDSLLNGKQATLVSGTNIKTINNESLLGSGNIDIGGGTGTEVSGTNDGTNWTSLTIDGDTYGIPGGGSGTLSLSTNLVGKKLSLIGDSITTYQGWLPIGNATRYPRGAITNVNQTWWKMLIDQTGMVIGQNCSWDGSTCSGLSTSTTNAYAGCSDKRISQVGLNGAPDIIICYIGINDWGATYNKNGTQYGGTFVDGAFVPVGDYTGETPVTSGEIKNFSDAYGIMITKLQNSYPNAKIYCCTLLQTNGKSVYNYDADGVFPSINRDGVTLAAYNNRIRLLADNLGVGLIDFAKCGVSWGNMSTYLEDGLHPTKEGMKLLTAVAKAKLISDFGYVANSTPAVTYTITNNLTNATTDNADSVIAENSAYSATISPASGYEILSNNVSITMGGTDITSSAWNNGAIYIPAVSGNIVINVLGTEIVGVTYTITNTLDHVSNSNATASVAENAQYTATLTANEGYQIDSVTITMGGTDITSTVYSAGSINIAAVTGNVVITASASLIPVTIEWYTNFSQTSTSSFVASSRGWALDETTYANIYNKPINRISLVATASSGSIDICVAPSKNAQSGFTQQQTINWTSANKAGNIVTLELPTAITLATGEYLCVYVASVPATGTACYANGGSAGQFYSYVGASGHGSWGDKGAYSIQMNIGYAS